MSNLEKVQKAMTVFQILSRIVMIFAYVGAAFTLAGGSLVMSGAVDAGGRFLSFLTNTANVMPAQVAWALIAAAVSLLYGGALATFAYRYFTAEIKEGTPFTSAGADRIKRFGITAVVLSILSTCITDGIFEKISLPEWNRFDDAGGITLGICLILLAMVVRYGAELEQKNKAA